SVQSCPASLLPHSHEHTCALLSFPTRRSSDRHTAYANSIAPPLSASSDLDLIKAWKESYIKTAASAVGARLDFKFSDDVISLREDRKSTRLNSSHVKISYAVFCLKQKN